MTYRLIYALLFTTIFWSNAHSSPVNSQKYIAIIIDDMGYNLERGTRALNLPGYVTYAVLPHTSYSRHFAEQIASAGREVMLHMPMENLQELKLGPGGLKGNQNRQQFLNVLRAALEDVPHVRGINNHMGSQLTQQETPMNWLMDELYQRNIYFVDSLTTANSVARRIADRKNLLASSRDIFLDNVRTYEAIDKAFKNAVRIAHSTGSAIAIGHPYRETIDYLQKAIPGLKSQGIQLLPVSDIAAYQSINAKRLLLAASGSQKKESGSLSSDL